MSAFDHKPIEERAREKWAALNFYQTDLTKEGMDPYYLLVEFPYPSGDLHIGHWYAFAVTDIFARFKRMQGKNVLFPIGFDAFGLPAENAAIRNKLDPKEWTYQNMERMRGQIRSMGASFDWSKEVVTCEPGYYKWTQWLFTKLFEQKLAYRSLAAVKWCPFDQTVLANEQVIDGRCERCGHEVEEKQLTQWFFKITDFAERLLKDLEPLPWREEIKEAQRAWIGKSEGAKLWFPLKDREDKIEVFTTRPDTMYGATYVVLAPEHPLVSSLLQIVSNKEAVEKYIEDTKKKTERERSENKEKTGVKLEGVSAINPATKEEIPVYLADYVLASYGTGAVMAVPAHDERDFEFAQRFNLPIRQVIAPKFIQSKEPGMYRPGEPIREKHGIIAIIRHWSRYQYLGIKWKKVAWGTFLTGGVDEGFTPEETVLKEITEETGFTHPKIIRKLGVVDGLFYHVPKQQNTLVHGHIFEVELEDNGRDEVSKEEKEKHSTVWLTQTELKDFLTADTHQYALRVFLEGYKPYTDNGSLIDSGEFSGRESEEAKWEMVKAVGGERTTNYRLRDWLVSRQRYWGCPIPIVYDPEGKPHAIPAENLPWLLPTDVDFTPTGEAPLASSKELKTRVEQIFGKGWTPEYDTLDTFVDSSWYFLRYLDPADSHDFSDPALMKKWLPVNRYSGGAEHTTMHLLYARFFQKALYDLALVPSNEPFHERYNRGIILGPDGQKMSKSKGNVINPDEYAARFGADAVRLYLAFIGPYNEPGSYPWNLEGASAMRKFLERVHTIMINPSAEAPSKELATALERTKAKISVDIERFKFNTAIAALMSLLNVFEEEKRVPERVLREFVILLAPFAPHLAEEWWGRLHGEGSVHQQPWPTADEVLLTSATVELVVQVNGKRRASLTLAPDAAEEEAKTKALEIESVRRALGAESPKRVIYVPGKILNLVI